MKPPNLCIRKTDEIYVLPTERLFFYNFYYFNYIGGGEQIGYSLGAFQPNAMPKRRVADCTIRSYINPNSEKCISDCMAALRSVSEPSCMAERA